MASKLRHPLLAMLIGSAGAVAQPALAVERECDEPDCQPRRKLAPARLRAGIGAFAFKAKSNVIDLGSAIPALDADDEYGSFNGAPAVSLGLMFEQSLSESPEYTVLLQEHLSLQALRPVLGADRGYALGGFADILIGMRFSDAPLSVALGPSIGLFHVEMNRDVPRPDQSPLVGPTLLVGLDLQDLPGWGFYGVGRIGKIFAPWGGEGDYASAELAASLEL